MIKLQIGFMRELRNSEFAGVIREVAKSLACVQTNEQPLAQLIDRMQYHSKEMYYLEDQKPSHPLTQVIGGLTQKRTNYLISLRLQNEGKMLSHKAEEQYAAKVLHLWMHKYRKSLFVASIIPQTASIMAMLAEKNSRSIIQQSLVTLRLDDLFEEIVEVTNEIVHHENVRMDDIPNKSRKGKALRSAAYADMGILVNIVGAMTAVDTENREGNIYYGLGLSIQLHLKKAHTVLKSRITKRRNKKNFESAVAKLVSTTPGKEKSVKPNKMLVQVLSEGYIEKASKVLTYSMADAEGQVKQLLLVRDNKRKRPIGKDWKWRFPQIRVN